MRAPSSDRIGVTTGISSRCGSKSGPRRVPSAAFSAPCSTNTAVGFRVMHGFGSATEVYNIAQDDDGRPLIALYVGDWDPSGLCMSEHDLPERLSRYDGEHVELERIALTRSQLRDLPSFPAADKKKDPRYNGSSRTSAIAAGSWTRSILMTCASVSKRKSSSTSNRQRGSAAKLWSAPSRNRCAR